MFGLDLEGSCKTITCFVFGHNQEGLIARYIACNQLYFMKKLLYLISDLALLLLVVVFMLHS